MSTTYSSTINVALATIPGFELPSKFQDVYGVLLPRSERSVIAAIGVEASKTSTRVRGAVLLDIMLVGRRAPELMEVPDEDVLRECLPELERHIPGVSTAIRFCHVNRWPEAEPRSPVGRSRTLRAYYSNRLSERRVLLAGDYLGFPHADSAAFTGKRAANFIARA